MSGSCPFACGTSHDTDAGETEQSESPQNHDGLSVSSDAFTYVVDDLVSVSRANKVDALWMKTVALSLRHLVGLLVFHLYR